MAAGEAVAGLGHFASADKALHLKGTLPELKPLLTQLTPNMGFLRLQGTQYQAGRRGC